MKINPGRTLRSSRIAIVILSIVMTAALTASCIRIPFLSQAASIASLRDLDFSMFSDGAVADTVSLHFTVKDPAALGLTVPEVSLGDVSKETSEETYRKFAGYQDQLKKINYEELSQEDQITYDVIEYDLNEALEYQDYYYYSSPFNSLTGLQTDLPLILSEYSLEDKADIEEYLLLLADVNRYYGDLMIFEKERADEGFGSSDENLQKIIDSCESFLEDREDHFLISSFAERLDSVPGLTDNEITGYIEQNKTALDTNVFPAYQLLIDGFSDLFGKGVNDGGLCNLPDGKKYYSLLLKSNTSSDSSVSYVKKQIEQSITDSIDLILASPDDAEFENAYNSYDFSEGTVQENLDYCEAAIKDDFPSIMKHDVTLKEVPDALEDFFSPAAYLSCAIDDPKDNTILTNTAALAGYPNLLETIAHEGYPGHMYEAIYHAENISSYYQRSASFIGYSEGWAEYASGYVLEESDYDQTLVAYIAAENRVFNLLFPARIDIGVNYEGWSREDVYDYLAEYNIDMQDYADNCYDMAIEIPCYYMPYCIGQIDVTGIITHARDELEDLAAVEEIHKAYLDIGPAPFPIVDKYMQIYIETEQD